VKPESTNILKQNILMTIITHREKTNKTQGLQSRPTEFKNKKKCELNFYLCETFAAGKISD